MSAELGQPGQIIDGKYKIVKLLGAGGMGAVFEGENLRIKRRVAIKLLHSSVSGQAEVVTRFEREAQAAAMVGSEHICEVLDLGELPDHTRYMVMEYLDGETLSSRIKRAGRLMPLQAIPILTQILEALGKAHDAGIIHRDLKPDNVFLLTQRSGLKDFVKILDFGVSKFSQLSGESMNVTRAGAVVGTPYYMSPEQARGTSAIDQRTDIYAIGVLLYQAITGYVPYNAETFNELLFKIVLEHAPPPQTYVPDLDPEFAAIVMRAMAREPTDRFQTCAQFAEALLAYQTAHTTGAAQPQRPSFSGPQPMGTQVLDMSALPASPFAPPQTHQGPLGTSSPGMHSGSNPPPQPQVGMSASMSGAQQAGYGAQQVAPPPGPPGAMATGAAWGNQSGAGTEVKPKSKAPMIIGIFAGVVLLGGAVGAAVFFMGGSGGNKAHAGGTETAATSAAPPPSAPPPVSATATVSAAPPPVADPPASATASAKPAAQPAPKPVAKPVAKPVGKPAGKPGKPGGDLGY